MIDSLLNSTTIPLLQKVAEFGERRQDVLAGNVANIDTPGYRTRDLPIEAFQNALRDAIPWRAAPRATADGKTAQPTLDELLPPHLFHAAEVQSRNLTFQDGGNRSIEHEVTEMTKNLMTQNFVIELMSAQMNLLQTVISGRV